MCIRDRVNDYVQTAMNGAVVSEVLDGMRTFDLVVRMKDEVCLLYTSPSPRDRTRSRMPSSA